MDIKHFTQKLFSRAKELGAEQAQATYSSSENFETNVFKGEVLEYSVSDDATLTLRVLIEGRIGSCSTEVFDDEAVDFVASSAVANARLIASDDVELMYDGSGSYSSVDSKSPVIDDYTEADKIAMAKYLERKALESDERIEQVEGSAVFSSKNTRSIENTLGLSVSHSSSSIGGYIAPVAKDGDEASSGIDIFILDGSGYKKCDEAVSNACKQALDYLKAGSVASGSYKCILRNDAAQSLLGCFAGIFSAENAQKGLSLLAGKENTVIASDKVTIIDDPLMEGKHSSCPFDSEGVPTYTKEIISSGTLNTLLHNLKTALKQGMKTTGNAAGKGVSAFNLFFKPGEKTLDELCEEMGDGIMICEMQGMHAGANAISGDFSLSAKGYLVENGKVTKPVRQITVASNFYTVLKSIITVGSDLEFRRGGGVGAPSLYIGEISVAGK